MKMRKKRRMKRNQKNNQRKNRENKKFKRGMILWITIPRVLNITIRITRINMGIVINIFNLQRITIIPTSNIKIISIPRVVGINQGMNIFNLQLINL